MTKITRRGALGLAGGAVGLAACATDPAATGLPVFQGIARFEHGVASGDPLQTSVIIWTRVSVTLGEGPVTLAWEVFKEGQPSIVAASGFVTTDRTRDYTVKVDVEGLVPATSYAYKFRLIGRDQEIVSPVGRTKTLAASGNTPVRAAVISCSNYPFGFFNVYDALAKLDQPLDAIIHLGDYIYEYGPDGYGGEVGRALDRNHRPAREIISLDDYRRRHAQYKSDRALQAAHASAPWICTWDDHESTNNSYRTGAQNHNEGEGSWTDRKQVAVQAYLEWMPVRDPKPGAAREALWRRFDFGDVASIVCLETRLTGRSEEISWGAELEGVAPEAIPDKVREVQARINDPARTMLGEEQERWLAGELKSSVDEGRPWQVLANQIIMARVRPPNFEETLSPADKDAIQQPLVKALIGFSTLGQPLNLDAWDGFPAARERLYESASAAGANLVTLTGDTHTGWANSLVDRAGQARGVEFGCTSVTSPGFGSYLPGVDGLGEMFADANAEVDWHDPHGNGFTLLELTEDEVRAEFFKVSDITSADYTYQRVAGFRAGQDGDTALKLKRF